MLGRFHRDRAVPALLGPTGFRHGTVIGALQGLAFVARGFSIPARFILPGVYGVVARLLQTDPAGGALSSSTGRARSGRCPASSRPA
jgi:hypothetical protein